MRHGCKSKSKAFNGYKRHLVGLAGTGIIAGAVVRPAKEPENEAAAPLRARRHDEVVETRIDRSYLGAWRAA